MNYVFGIIILLLWFGVFIATGWSKKYSVVVNIIFGSIAFILIGVCYLVPAWLLLWK